MKVVCTCNIENSLIYGKIYDVNLVRVNGGTEFYYVKNEHGINFQYHKSRFDTLEEFRNRKINDILK